MKNRDFLKVFTSMTVILLTFMLASCFSYAASAQNASGKVNANSGAVLRAKASTSSDKIVILKDNTNLIIEKEIFTSKTSVKSKYKWYYVKAGTKKGYIRSDLVDNLTYNIVSAKTTDNVNYRVGPGTKMSRKGTLKKGKSIKVYLKAKPVSSTKGDSSTWYKIKIGGSYRYVCSAYVSVSEKSDKTTEDGSEEEKKEEEPSSDEPAQTDEDKFEAALTAQGFPETYKTKLKELHKTFPNWVFTAKKMSVNWGDAVKAESKDKYSVISSSLPTKYRATDSNSYNEKSGKWISKCGGGWYNANSQTIAYYMDPRNFLNDESIYMFEQLSYNSDYQTEKIVDSILTSKLKEYGFTADLFIKAAKNNNISPIHLAARVRQENGSGSACVNGTKYKDSNTGVELTVYNPFNIHASGDNPVQSALKYAYECGWTSQTIALEAGAKILAKEYINVGQDTLYFQRFNFNSKGAATHQYMQNLLAPYLEANTTRKAYLQYGICSEALTFVIPVYEGMPESTSLPI